jgi:hypothetical protein
MLICSDAFDGVRCPARTTPVLSHVVARCVRRSAAERAQMHEIARALDWERSAFH